MKQNVNRNCKYDFRKPSTPFFFSDAHTSAGYVWQRCAEFFISYRTIDLCKVAGFSISHEMR